MVADAMIALTGVVGCGSAGMQILHCDWLRGRHVWCMEWHRGRETGRRPPAFLLTPPAGDLNCSNECGGLLALPNDCTQASTFLCCQPFSCRCSDWSPGPPPHHAFKHSHLPPCSPKHLNPHFQPCAGDLIQSWSDGCDGFLALPPMFMLSSTITGSACPHSAHPTLCRRSELERWARWAPGLARWLDRQLGCAEARRPGLHLPLSCQPHVGEQVSGGAAGQVGKLGVVKGGAVGCGRGLKASGSAAALALMFKSVGLHLHAACLLTGHRCSPLSIAHPSDARRPSSIACRIDACLPFSTTRFNDARLPSSMAYTERACLQLSIAIYYRAHHRFSFLLMVAAALMQGAVSPGHLL